MSTHGANTLVTLPRPLGSAEGQYHAASVWSWENGSRKRKRSEIAVGIDGEGVNLYNVETPRLATSYALPPHVSFTCPPCSIRQKQRDQGLVQRLTYASTVNQGPQLVCFLDVIKRKKSRAGPPPETSGAIFTHDIRDSQRDVVLLDVIPVQSVFTEGSITNDIIVVHADGEVRCLAGNLKEERWRASPRTVLATAGDDSLKTTFDIDYATMADVAAGREGLLQGQGDAIAVLESQLNKDPQNASRIRLLILISKPSTNSASQSKARTLHVLTVCPDLSSRKSKFNRGTIRSLCKINLPDLENTSALDKVSVHVSSGTLQFIADGVLFTYNLTGTSPKLLSRLPGVQKDIVSFLRLPSGHTLTATPTSLTNYDLLYESIQGTMCIAETRPSTSSSLKRKLTGTADQQQECVIDLLTFLPSVGLAIGRIRNQLVGYDLSLGRTDRGHAKRMKAGSLIDALGHDIRSERSKIDTDTVVKKAMRAVFVRDLTSSSPKQDTRWQTRQEQLEQYARSQDVIGFEKVFAAEVGIRRNEVALREWQSLEKDWLDLARDTSPARVNGEHLPNGTHNGDLVGRKAFSVTNGRSQILADNKPIPEWYWTDSNGEPTKQKPMHPEKVIFVLGKLFSYNGIDGRTPIDEHWTDGKVNGNLSIVLYAPNVIRWLLESGNLTTRNIDLALRDAGSKFNHHVLVTPESLVTALLEVDSKANLPLSFLHAPVLLGAEEVVRAMKPLIYRLKRDADLNTTELTRLRGSLSLAARGNGSNQERHANHATRTMDAASSLDKALSVGLTKLNTFPAPNVTKAFRSFLTTDELMFIIHSLRKNLVAQGWTSWLLDVENADVMAGDDNGGINLIANLLSCAIDSFGPGALIYSPSISGTLTDPDELVTALKEEISAALDVVEEATYLRGVVGEMLRHGKPGVTSTENDGRRKGPADIVVVNTCSSGTNVLPLGLNREADVSREKIKAGGVIGKRTARDIARLESMKVGKYTMEKIIV